MALETIKQKAARLIQAGACMQDAVLRALEACNEPRSRQTEIMLSLL